MKNLITYLIVLISLLANTLYAQELRKVEQNFFKRGELLTYRVYYESLITGDVTAGKATLEIKNENKKIANRNTLHVVGTGKTMGAFNWFFKVNDRYETYIDEEALAPWLFIRRVDEGGWIIKQDVTFNQFKHQATTIHLHKNNKVTTVNVIENVQDIISTFYYARTFDMTNVKVKDEFYINFFLDDSVFTTKIIYLGKEVVKTSLGKYRCMMFKPMVLTGNVFKDPYPMTLWISDDENRIPILAESAILVGSVKMELVKYSGVANLVTSKVE